MVFIDFMNKPYPLGYDVDLQLSYSFEESMIQILDSTFNLNEYTIKFKEPFEWIEYQNWWIINHKIYGKTNYEEKHINYESNLNVKMYENDDGLIISKHYRPLPLKIKDIVNDIRDCIYNLYNYENHDKIFLTSEFELGLNSINIDEDNGIIESIVSRCYRKSCETINQNIVVVKI